ncbi:MAG: glycosyltransferase family 4 protein [Candidatus Bipolaricaulia bacterium]
MRIGLFTDTYLPEANGVVTVVRLMEQELRRAGHEVYIFAPAYPGGFRADSPGVYRFPSTNFRYYKGMRIALPYSRPALQLIPSLEILHSHDPFSLGLLALWASKRYGIPHIHTYHTLYAEYRRYLPRPIRPSREMTERLSRAFCNRCQAIIAPSEQMKRELECYGITRPIYPLPFGLDEEEFVRPTSWDVRAAFGLGEEDLLLYVGRLGIEKNLEFLLRAYKRLLEGRPKVRLILAGEGPQRRALEDYATGLGLQGRVIFTGYLPRERLIDLYRQATLFVFASKTETQGLVLLEAMMAGLPPVALGALGVLDLVVSGETGLLVDEDADEAEFAQAVLRLLEDEQERQRLGKAAQRWASERTARASTTRLLEIYEAVRLGRGDG